MIDFSNHIQDVDRILIVFENTDVMILPIKFIGIFDCSNFDYVFFKHNYNKDITQTIKCSHVFMEVYAEVDRYMEYAEFNILSYKRSIIDRLQCGDITCIQYLTSDNTTSPEFYVDWVDANSIGVTNSLQTSYISDLGNLYILIDKSSNVVDYIKNTIGLDNVNSYDMLETHKMVLSLHESEWYKGMREAIPYPIYYMIFRVKQKNEYDELESQFFVRVPNKEDDNNLKLLKYVKDDESSNHSPYYKEQQSSIVISKDEFNRSMKDWEYISQCWRTYYALSKSISIQRIMERYPLIP